MRYTVDRPNAAYRQLSHACGCEMSLWNDLLHPWQICVEEAWTAYCAGSIPIGAAILDPTGLLVARGHNRIHARLEAEQIEISDATTSTPPNLPMHATPQGGDKSRAC